MKSSPGPNQIENRQDGKKNRTNPFPSPRNEEHNDDHVYGKQMNQQGQDCLPKAETCIEHIQSEQAQKNGKKNTKNPRRPEDELFADGIHIDSLHNVITNGIS
jgi:hypothetical protein